MSTKTIPIMRDGVIVSETIEVDDEKEAGLVARAAAKRAERNPPIIEGAVLLARLTDAEWSSIQAESRANAQISRWMTTATATNQINLASAETLAAKARLVESGRLTQKRASIVFAPQM